MDPTVTLVRLALLTLLVALVAGCGQNESTTAADWKRVDPESLQPSMNKLYDRAERARQDLGKTLFGRLSEVLSSQGPRAAIEVCNVEAQGMTRDIGNQYDVSIGRTSFRLRNPDNVPPAWAKEFNLVEKRVKKQVVLKKGLQRLAVFTPIHLAPKCVTCHGPKEQIPQGVRKELEERYPQDQATGFQPGDLRGWFWVEVPARARTSF